jgi:hypothetical protein
MPESFGAELRLRREQRQIPLTTIAEQTKIKLTLLEALERDDVSRWPSGIFRRAFVRAYAQAIGLDPDVVVHDFMDRYPDPIEVAAAASANGPDGNPAPVSDGPPPTRFRYIANAALDSLSQRLGFLQRGRVAGEDLAAAPSAAVKTAEDSVPAPPVEDRAPVITAPPPMPDLVAAARVCTELSRVDKPRDATPLLQEAARILDAVGLIVWVWDPKTTELKPALTCGYPATVLAQLPRVRRDADNATAAAFRSAQTSVVNDSTLASGALVVPMMTPAGCAGVLAIELPLGSAQRESVRAVVTIFAAQLARLVGVPRATGAVDRKLA